MIDFYYHNHHRVNNSWVPETKESYDDVYMKSVLLNTHHIEFIKNETSPPELDTTKAQSGTLIKPNLIDFLNATGGNPKPITTLVPESNNGILIIYFNSLFNCTLKQLDQILNYDGHIIIDDTFEPCLTRVMAAKEWLEELGYDLNNITFWTNVPDYDNNIDINSRVIRHNWLHLTEYFKSSGSIIKEIEDKKSLKNFDNKEKTFLYMNGHCTMQRAYILGCNVYQRLNFKKILFSYRTEIKNFQNYRSGANILDCHDDSYKTWDYRELKGDTNDVVTVRDRFKQDWWWQKSFFNVNVETNLHYRNHKVRFISEKWMKGILYYTPSFNIGDYNGLEEYQETLGFDNYSSILPKHYDQITCWRTRGRQFSRALEIAQDEFAFDREIWTKCMAIADHNYHHLHDTYIPELTKLFYDTVEKVVDKS